MKMLCSAAVIAGVVTCMEPSAAFGQSPAGISQAVRDATSAGTIVSATTRTLVIRTDADQYELYVLDSSTTRPQALPVRASVTVMSRPSEELGAPVATLVRITAPPPEQEPRPVGTTGVAPAADEPIPQAIRDAERTIQRQVRRYRIGMRAAAGLDPELMAIGAQGQLGPFFSDNVWARPNIEFGFGEVTTLIALNLEGMYRLPLTVQQGRWSVFVGGGPGFHFQNRGFGEGESRFHDFDLDTGLNLFIGLQLRSGMFLELKGTSYAAPATRFVIGYNF